MADKIPLRLWHGGAMFAASLGLALLASMLGAKSAERFDPSISWPERGWLDFVSMLSLLCGTASLFGIIGAGATVFVVLMYRAGAFR